MMDMTRDAMQWIKDQAATEIHEIDGRTYADNSLVPILEPAQEPITVHTLTGLVDYVNSSGDVLSSPFVHVCGHDKVELLSGVFGSFKQRATYIVAVLPERRTYPFGTHLAIEDFIINLQSQFVQDDETARILALVGNLKDEKVRAFNDDGVTQTVTARAGIAKVEDVRVPNPVMLRPYRTFLEVEQPEISCVLRLRSGREGELPSCALFEADGGLWKLEAIGGIRDWLTERLPSVPIVA